MLDLIAQAASNIFLIFCFCNLIIVTILVGSKANSNFGQENGISTPIFTSKCKMRTQAKSSGTESRASTCFTKEQMSKQVQDVNKEEESQEEGNSVEDENDELRKRVEEFIDEVNKSWMAEKLTPNL